MDNGIVHVVGVSASGLEDLAPHLRALVADAEVLAGGERHLAMVRESDAEKIVLRGDLEVAVRRLDERRKGRRAVVLASGDPLFYGIGRLLLEHVRREDLVFHPALSSVQLAFARLKIPWDDAVVVSLHGRPIDRLEPALEAGRTPIAVLTDPRNTPAEIGRFLLRHGEYTVHVCENLGGGDDERVTSLSPAETTRHDPFSLLNVVVLTRNDAPRPSEGIPDEAFTTRPGQAGMITKVEVRVLTLSRLALRAGHVMYDVGAGSGSVSIEAGRLAPGARIFAVERRAEDVAVLRANLERFAVSNVSVIEGEAPEALRDLPEADRVFVGGSGGRLRPILEMAHARLRAGGIIVLNAISLESTWESVDRLRALACDVDFLDVHVSRSALLGGRLVRTPLHPVTIVRGIKR